MIYKILWLDDEFSASGNESKPSQMDLMYQDFINGQKEDRFRDFDITRCSNYEEFVAYFENDVYHAVILDVIGRLTESDIKKNDYPFTKAVNYLKDKDVIIKVFSGDPEKSVTEGSPIMLMKDFNWQEGKEIFYKQNDYFALFLKLEEDLKQLLNLYRNREYLLDMFSPEKQYLPNEDQGRIKELVKSYANKDSNITNKGYLRELLQDVLESFVYKDEDDREPYQFVKDSNIGHRKATQGRFGSLFKQFYWRADNPTKEQKKIEFIGDVVQFLGNACNKFKHSTDYSPSELPEFCSMADYMQSVYRGFFTVLSWYYRQRENGKIEQYDFQ